MAFSARIDTDQPADFHVGLYRQMLLIRGFEERVQQLLSKGEVHGTTHLYSGEEACAVGAISVLREGDKVAATYRGHGQALALGLTPQKLMDELLGRASGICGGRAGSMNVVDLEHGLVGCFGIIGGSTGAATGAALALRGTGNVAVAFFGEGTTNHGYFHECLNFAKVLKLPVLFMCENNQYGEFTPYRDVTAGEILQRGSALGIPSHGVDGNDVWAVRDQVANTLRSVRAGDGPAFIEAQTYRFVGHSRSDPGRYRPPGELEMWKERDPILVAAERLGVEYGLSAVDLEAVAREVDAELDEVVRAALAAPFPDPNSPVREFKP